MAADRCVLTLLLVSTLMVLSNVNASDSASSKDLELADLLPEGLVCPGKYDVVVMLDRSGEVPREVFTKYVDFIKNKLIHLFGVEEGGSHFGLVHYNDNPQIVMRLNENNNATFIKNYLKTRLPRIRGDRNLQKALRETRSQLLTEATGDRPDAPNICLLFTTEDGAWVKRNDQFPKINEVCDRFVRWRFGDYNNPNKVLERLCPPLSAEEVKNKTTEFCEGLFTCKSKMYKDLKKICAALGMISAHKRVWIGLMDMTGDNADWRWIKDGTGLTFENWGFRQPGSKFDKCVAAATEDKIFGLWHDELCSKKFKGVCETILIKEPF